VTGDSVDDKHKGWFEIDSFSFGATDQLGGGASGRAAGRASFSPLTVDFRSLTGLAPLFADLTSGKRITTVELAATTGGEDLQTVYDLKLSNALLSDFDNASSGNGIDTSLTINFQKASLTDHGVTTDGGPSTTAVTAALTTNDTTVVTTDTASFDAGAFSGDSPFRLFLKVDGVTGDSSDDKHKGWFAVDSFDFDAKRATNATGLPTGRTQAGPLTVDISSIQGLAPLFADQVSGKHIASVELAETDGGLTVYDIKLTNALLAMVQNAGTLNSSIDTSLSFTFQKVTLTDHGLNGDGGVGPAESASFNVSRNAKV
jgi:type VI secretion system secreted protein Hcp